MKKSLAVFRSIFLIPVMYSVNILFGSLMNTGIIGKVLYGALLIFIIIGILGMLFKNHNINNSISYNIIFIIIEIFTILISCLYNKLIASGIYMESITQLKLIYLFFIMLILGVVINTLSTSFDNEKEKD